MANYNSIGAYEAQTLIPKFLGLMQHGDGINADPRYAVDVLNMDTPGGVLQPMAACMELKNLSGLGEWEPSPNYVPLDLVIGMDGPSGMKSVKLSYDPEWIPAIGAECGYLMHQFEAEKEYSITVWATSEPSGLYVQNDKTNTIIGFSEFTAGQTDGDWTQYSSTAIASKESNIAKFIMVFVDVSGDFEDVSFSGLVVDGVEIVEGANPMPKLETLATLHRRWYTGQDDKNIFIAAASGKLYAALPTAPGWTELDFPDGVAEYSSDVWSWASYEINPPGSSAPVDVLLLSNAKDGMVMVRGDDLSVEVVETPKKFGVIARYAERIWGGAITDDPDMLVYSAPFDPTNWDEDVDFPEDGAGDIMQPSWDGDSFTALHAFGSQLIAFKRTRVWRILGTDPGEYAFKEQYGGGAPYHATIAVDAERIFMLTQQGLAVYDGLSVNPFRQEFAEGVFRHMNKAKLDQACGCIWQDRYYLALPLGTSIINNAVLIFNLKNNTWLLREDVSVEAFQPTEDALYFTSSTTPGKIWTWKEDSWLNGATTAACKWTSPWNDLGHQEIKKGGFDVYLLCEVKNTASTISLSIQTEKKTKTKTYTVQPLGEGQTEFRQKRLHFGGSGRRFRIIIESAASMPVWRLIGGIRIISETDPD